VNGQPEAATNGKEQAIYAPVVLSEALAEQVKDLLTASEDAARAIKERAEHDADALRRTATRAAVEEAGRAMTVPSEEKLPELEATVSELRELVDDLRTDVDRLTTELTLVGSERRSLPPPSDAQTPPPGFDRRALLIALNMALNGAPQAEVDRYLAENFDLADAGLIVAEVYTQRARMRPRGGPTR